MTRTTRHGHGQLTLGGLIDLFERLPLTWSSNGGPRPKPVYFDFANTAVGHLTSWRGSYRELAFTFNDPDRGASYGSRIPRADELLRSLQCALEPGFTFGGWKGGEYQMDRDTPLWVAPWGQSSCTAVVGVRDLDYDGLVIDTDWCEF